MAFRALAILILFASLDTFIAPVEPTGNPLTTHVLDLSKGLPGSNIRIKLFKYRRGIWVSIKAGTTNEDGRLGHLISQERFTRGTHCFQRNT